MQHLQWNHCLLKFSLKFLISLANPIDVAATYSPFWCCLVLCITGEFHPQHFEPVVGFVTICRVIPRIYHSLDLDMYNNTTVLAPSSHSVDRVVLLACAKPSSFLFTRRLISRMSDAPFNFAVFSQLTHLSLWGRNFFDVEPHGPREADEIVTLPLEELFVWEEYDNVILLGQLTVDVTIYKTLRRYGCYSRRSENRPDEGWHKCPNLIQILILFASISWFDEIAASGVVLPSCPNFRSLIISPFANIGSPPLRSQNSLGKLAQDKRIVILRNFPIHFFQHPRAFWENHIDMWRIALCEIDKNENHHGMTVIENLPWAGEEGFYNDLS
ncbi:hypothetical protein DL96DRAFT_1626971 [Flagelloscypha sp. PMI_526]|nr:hypothetical protein DL96DRAFT_1626971 [Flagelloscypha sp. PMI_526]